MAPILCTTVTTKQSLLGLGWTIVTSMSILAFLCSGTKIGLIRSRYKSQADMYTNGYAYYNDESGDNQSEDNEIYDYLASFSSQSVNISFVYIAGLTLALALYGGLFVVGFMYPNGRYAPPPFASCSHKMKINYGIFTSSLTMFSNLCLIFSFVLSKLRVDDMRDEREREDIGDYALEKIAIVLSVMFIFLTVIYFTFSIILFSLKSVLVKEGKEEEETHKYYPPRMSVSSIT